MLEPAPYPERPKRELSQALRTALVSAWSMLRHGKPDQAYSELERIVQRAIPDLETYSVEAWNETYRQLEESRPK